MLKSLLRKKGVILVGGSGHRLKPNTIAINKHLFPVYDKPMIYYPLSILILAGMTEIAIVGNESDLKSFKHLLGDGRKIGIEFSYFCQKQPLGIVDALIACKDFWVNTPFTLILGDNLFYGSGLSPLLSSASRSDTSTIFGYQVSDPKNYGVIEFSKDMHFIKIVEKPKSTTSDLIATGLYFFSSNLIEYIEKIKISPRGEYEITELLSLLASEDLLKVKRLNRGVTWFDMGTVNNLSMASNFVQNVQFNQGFIVGSPEEASWRMKNISNGEFKLLCQTNNCRYLKNFNDYYLSN